MIKRKRENNGFLIANLFPWPFIPWTSLPSLFLYMAIHSMDKFTFAIFVHGHSFHGQVYLRYFCTWPFIPWTSLPSLFLYMAIHSMDKFTFAIFVHGHSFHGQVYLRYFCTWPFIPWTSLPSLFLYMAIFPCPCFHGHFGTSPLLAWPNLSCQILPWPFLPTFVCSYIFHSADVWGKIHIQM